MRKHQDKPVFTDKERLDLIREIALTIYKKDGSMRHGLELIYYATVFSGPLLEKNGPEFEEFLKGNLS